MEQSNFYNLKSLISGKNWLKNTQGRKISWNKIIEVKVTHLKPHTLQHKHDLEDEYLELNADEVPSRARRGRPPKTAVESATNVESLILMYLRPIAISKSLHDDLLSLSASETIPKYYHCFYESLTSSETINEDAPDNSDQDDAEV